MACAIPENIIGGIQLPKLGCCVRAYGNGDDAFPADVPYTRFYQPRCVKNIARTFSQIKAHDAPDMEIMRSYRILARILGKTKHRPVKRGLEAVTKPPPTYYATIPGGKG